MLKLFLLFVVSATLLKATFCAPLETTKKIDLSELRDELEDKLETSTSTESSISTEKAETEDKETTLESVKQTTQYPSLPTSLSPSTLAVKPEATLTRRIVTFDQRQEGKFNVRADLENLLIIFVTDSSDGTPSASSPQQTLLELLTRSAANSKANVNKNQNKKYKKDEKVLPLGDISDYSAFKVPQFKPNYYQQFTQSRSPYHVDIDSNMNSRALYLQSSPTGSLNEYQQVDHPPLIQFLKAIPSAGQ